MQGTLLKRKLNVSSVIFNDFIFLSNKLNDGVISDCLESQKTYKIQAITIDPKTKQVTKLKIIDGKYMNGVYTKIKPVDAK